MTPEERAEEVVWGGDWHKEVRPGGFCDPGEYDVDNAELKRLITDAIRAAVEAERERIARDVMHYTQCVFPAPHAQRIDDIIRKG